MSRASSPHRRGSLSVRLFGSLLAIAGFLGVIAFLLPAPEQRKTDPETGGSVPSAAVDNTSAKSEQELARILDKMRPGRLGISTDRTMLTDELNRWARTFAKEDDQLAKLTDDKELRERLFTPEMLAHSESARFLPEDVSHVREAMLSRAILDSMGKSARNDPERLVRIFEFVTRTIQPIPAELKQQLPMTPYESLLFGIGTATDRAWAFASIVAQPPLMMDAMILQPRDAGKRDHWLVGATNADGKVFLFDPHEGVPIPSPSDSGDSPLPKRAGTLDEILSDDGLLRRLDLADSPYPLTAADLKEPDVLLIGNTSQWSPRLAKLRFLMPGNLAIEVYQGLGANELRKTGVYDRVSAAGGAFGWTADSIKLWDYPETQRSLIESAKGAEGTQLAQYFDIFRGPIILKEDRETGQVYLGPSDKSLHYVRMLQLTGEFGQALQDYLPIRGAAQIGADGQPIPANLIVADYAAIWSGICQVETGRPGTALGTFERYGKSTSSGQARTAAEWGAQCHVAEGRFGAAAQLLTSLPPGMMPRRDAWLIGRWRKLAGENAAPAATEPKPTETVPQESGASKEKPGDASKPVDPEAKKEGEPTPTDESPSASSDPKREPTSEAGN